MRHNLPSAWLLVLLGANASFGQGLTPATPAKEYVRLNGSVVAIENAPPAAPTISILSPSAGTVVAGTSVGVTVSAGSTVTSVQLQIDGANAGAPSTTPPFNLTFNSTTLSNASHDLKAVATSPGGKYDFRAGFGHGREYLDIHHRAHGRSDDFR